MAWFDGDGQCTHTVKLGAEFEPGIGICPNLWSPVEREVVAAEVGMIAMRQSEHQASRYRGGLIGLFTGGIAYGDLDPAVVEAAKELQPGKFTGVIEAREGLYVARLTRRTSLHQRPLASVSAKLRRELLVAREAELREAFHQRLLSEFPGVVHNIPADLLPSPVAAREPLVNIRAKLIWRDLRHFREKSDN